VHPRLRAGGRRLAMPVAAACLSSVAAVAAAVAAPTDSPSARQASVTIASTDGDQKLRFGGRLRLDGRVAGAGEGVAVQLEDAPGGRPWRAVRTTSTRADGGYWFELRALRSGAYRASAADGAVSAPRQITVAGALSGRATHHLCIGARVRVRGAVRPGVARRVVRVQRLARGGWRTVALARTNGAGGFRAAWRSSATGVYRLRLRFAGDALNGAATNSLHGGVHVYRAVHASWYGPGFYGSRTACGQTMSAWFVGAAHKSLPCGTRVVFRHRGRSVAARVIDRGPFVAGRKFDLTSATKSRLGFGGVGVVWSTR
jgi:rare lipoprotein A